MIRAPIVAERPAARLRGVSPRTTTHMHHTIDFGRNLDHYTHHAAAGMRHRDALEGRFCLTAATLVAKMHGPNEPALTTRFVAGKLSFMKLSIAADIELGAPSLRGGYVTWFDVSLADGDRVYGHARVALSRKRTSSRSEVCMDVVKRWRSRSGSGEPIAEVHGLTTNHGGANPRGSVPRRSGVARSS